MSNGERVSDGDLSAQLTSARAVWGALALADDAFAAWLAARPEAAVAHVADLYLACACDARVAGALEAFDRVYLSRVDEYLSRQRLPSGALDDLKQQLRERLFVQHRVRDYSGRGSLSSWLRVIAVRAAVDLERKTTEKLFAERSGSSPIDALRAAGEPELDYVKEAYRGAVAQAVRGSLHELDSEQRNLLALHFVEGLTLDELAALFRVHRATVARRLAAAREAVLDEARRLFCAQTQVTPDEADSLFTLVRSQLDLTLSSLLVVAR